MRVRLRARSAGGEIGISRRADRSVIRCDGAACACPIGARRGCAGDGGDGSGGCSRPEMRGIDPRAIAPHSPFARIAARSPPPSPRMAASVPGAVSATPARIWLQPILKSCSARCTRLRRLSTRYACGAFHTRRGCGRALLKPVQFRRRKSRARVELRRWPCGVLWLSDIACDGGCPVVAVMSSLCADVMYSDGRYVAKSKQLAPHKCWFPWPYHSALMLDCRWRYLDAK